MIKVTNNVASFRPPARSQPTSATSSHRSLYRTAGNGFGGPSAVLAGAAILFALWKWWQKRKANTPVEPPVPAHVRAKQKLEEALALISQPKPFCILVSDTIRAYLEEQFDFRAPERTTEEFLRELRDTELLTAEQKESLGEFLESCDLVKFAKYEPREPELRELHGSAAKLVDETEPKPELPPVEDTRDPRLQPQERNAQ